MQVAIQFPCRLEVFVQPVAEGRFGNTDSIGLLDKPDNESKQCYYLAESEYRAKCLAPKVDSGLHRSFEEGSCYCTTFILSRALPEMCCVQLLQTLGLLGALTDLQLRLTFNICIYNA